MRLQILMAVLTALPLCALAQTYKCKQPDGRLSFQDQPCQSGTSGSKVDIRPTPPSANPADIEKMKAASSRSKFQPAPTPKADEEIKARNQQIEAHNRSVRCESARRNLGALKSGRPVFSYNNAGEKQYVEDAARSSELGSAQRQVAEYCN